MLPLWLAVSASVALHIGLLLSPGWSLPLDDEHDAERLDATLQTIPRAVASPAAAAPAPVRRLRPRKPAAPPTPATPEAPVAALPETAPAVPAAAAQPATAATQPDEAATTPEPPPEAAAQPESPPAAAPPAPSFVSQWPRSGRIVFQVTRGEDGFIVGQSEHRWQHDGASYSLRAVTETVGLAALFRPARVLQESRGVFDAAGLRPLEFDTQREGKNKDSVRFDSAQGRIFFGKEQSAAFVVAAQDMLSLFYQLGAIAFDVPQFVITVATGRKVAEFAVAVGPVSELETPAGSRPVRHLRISGSAREDATEVWLDTESHLPLRIRHRDRKGEVFDQITTLIELKPTE